MDPKSQVESFISELGEGTVSVGFYDLKEGNEWFILPDDSFHAASTMKVCVMMELFRQAEQGNFTLRDRLLVHNEFPSLVDGSPFSVGEADDSEKELYSQLGEQVPLIDLAVPMIANSSNLATNLLVELLGAPNVTDFMRKLGAHGVHVRRGVEDGKAFQMGLNNSVTARGLTAIMTRLGRLEVVSPDASKAMIDILLAQKHRNCIPAKLPPNAQVANKTGWNDKTCHDVGIVYPHQGNPYVLAVLTQGIDEERTAPELIATISELVYGTTATCPNP